MEFSNFVQETENRISFDIQGISLAESNALRRSLIRHIPVMQIADDIGHIECKSLGKQPVRRAFITNLKQVPFLVDPACFASVNLGVDCPLDEYNSLKFHLYQDYPYPLNEKGQPLKYDSFNCPQKRVLSSSIKWIPHSDEQKQRIIEHHRQLSLTGSDFAKTIGFNFGRICRPAYEDIILAVLDPGECIDVTFYLTAGTKAGQNHVCFSAVNIVSAPAIPVVSISDPVMSIEDAHELLRICPQNVFTICNSDTSNNNNNNNNNSNNANSNKAKVVVSNAKDCSHCEQCVRSTKPFSKKIKIAESPNSFHFTIESHGSLPVKSLFTLACDAVISKSRDMLKQIPS